MDFKKESRPFFVIIFKLKNGNFKTQDFSPLIERVLAGVTPFNDDEQGKMQKMTQTKLSFCQQSYSLESNDLVSHGLRTSNEGINRKNLGRKGRKNLLWPYLKIWELKLIFGRAVKVISSPGVRSPWHKLSQG